ncbi:S8 family peptidase [Paenibacillus sp. GCM10012307]|uniref:Peptidase S8 n=1 Tax=Paenibacillus roseus TaxID=2798579 RepID=A0A934JA70_9BACL|nr:S8 family peptidase [Paenibacillus roseus]MBJ6363125.1 peptidase S8 [Paenibacillus roseus]
MRRKKMARWFMALAALALIIHIAPIFIPSPSVPRQTAEAPKPAPLEERKLKLASLQNDMDKTAMLCHAECRKQMTKAIAFTGNDQKRRAYIRTMMKEHPHMEYMSWQDNTGSKPYGALPAGMSDHVEQAKVAVKKGKEYHSGTLKLKSGARYMVLATPDRKHPGHGLVGVVKQHILDQVEQHQLRNLRLVPYPHETKYKTKAVEPGTLHRTEVHTGEDNGDASHYHTNEVVVRFHQNPNPQHIQQIRKEINADHVHKLGYTFVFRSKSMKTEELIHYFKKNYDPHYVEPHYFYMTNWKMKAEQQEIQPIIPNDALYSQYQWNLPSIETEKGWNVERGTNEIVVAVLDTGVQADHPDLKGQLMEGINIVDKNAKPDDDVGHGTHVSGIIAAVVNNGEGVAGLSWYNKVLPVKVLDASGAGTTYSVAEGIIWATDHGAKVINMSLGNYASAEFLHDAIKYAYDHDVVLVAASGNDNTDRPGYPAAYPEVFAVAATDTNGQRASFSNYGDYIDVAAPGASIASTYPGSQYAALSGTSMASPHVAALAALIRSKNPELTNKEVMQLMRDTSTDLGAVGKDTSFGYGQIDVVRALSAAVGGLQPEAKGSPAPGASRFLLGDITRLIRQKLNEWTGLYSQ